MFISREERKLIRREITDLIARVNNLSDLTNRIINVLEFRDRSNPYSIITYPERSIVIDDLKKEIKMIENHLGIKRVKKTEEIDRIEKVIIKSK